METRVWWYAARSSKEVKRPGKRKCEAQEASCRGGIRQIDDERSHRGKLLSSEIKREVVDHLQVRFKVSQRRACKVVGLYRSTKRYVPREDIFKEKLRERIIYFAKLYGRYGYRKITELLNREGWNVGKDRVHRIWREDGLQVPQKQPKRARLWFNDGSCIRKRPECPGHVWAYDLVSDRTRDGKSIKILNIIDEFTKECLVSYVARRIRSREVIFILADLFLERGTPTHIRSDNVLSPKASIFA